MAVGESGDGGGDGFADPMLGEIDLVGGDLQGGGHLVDRPFADHVEVVDLVLRGGYLEADPLVCGGEESMAPFLLQDLVRRHEGSIGDAFKEGGVASRGRGWRRWFEAG